MNFPITARIFGESLPPISAAGYQAWGGPPRDRATGRERRSVRRWRLVALLAGRLHAGAADDSRVLSEGLGTIWICRRIQSFDP
jgi:hypothetical protein